VYPQVTQLDTARAEVERELQLLRERPRAQPRPPRYKLARLTWGRVHVVVTVLRAELRPGR
jgi:hypothetical protein